MDNPYSRGHEEGACSGGRSSYGMLYGLEMAKEKAGVTVEKTKAD